MDKSKKIKRLSKDYFVTLEGKPVCPPFNDEAGVFDNKVMPLYRAMCVAYPETTHLVCVTTFDIDDEKLRNNDNPPALEGDVIPPVFLCDFDCVNCTSQPICLHDKSLL